MSRFRHTRSLVAPIGISALVAMTALLAGPTAVAEPSPFVAVATNAVWTYPGDSYVFLGSWTPGTVVDVTVDTPPLGSIDETYTVEIDAGGGHGFVRTPTTALQPGTVVTAGGGGVSKDLTIAPFRPERLDAGADIIAGVAPIGTVLSVLVPSTVGGEPPLFEATVTAGADDAWSVATAPFDLLEGHEVEVRVYDAEGDYTYRKHVVRTPRIVASVTYAPPGGPPEYVWVGDWVPGTPVHLEVDRDADGSADWTRDLIVGVEDGGSNLGTEGLLQTGAVLTATGGGWSKQVEVVEVRVEYANPIADVVAGIVPAGSLVRVEVRSSAAGGPPDASVVVTPDADGWWRTAFALDLGSGGTAQASIDDPDGDVVMHGADLVVATVDAYAGPGSGLLVARHWPLGTPFTIEVDLDADGTPDATFDALQPGCSCIPTGFELQTGAVVTMTAEHGVDPDRWVRRLVVEDVHITGIDFAADRVSGTAPDDGRTVAVDIVTGEPGPPGASLTDIPVEPGGSWTADFAGTFDLQPGMSATVHLTDDDGDSTSRGFFAEPTPVVVWAWPNVGLWDGREVGVYADGLTPGTTAIVLAAVATDPAGQHQVLGGLPVGQGGAGWTNVQVPRWIGGVDCSATPGTCTLVVADQIDPYGRNGRVALTFSRLDLFRYTPDDPNDPDAGGVIGDPVGDVAHHDWVWVVGSGFAPDESILLGQCGTFRDTTVGQDQVLCRSMDRAVFPDGDGTFAAALQLGRNVFSPLWSSPDVAVAPAWDLRDGQTVVVSATGLPRGPWGEDADCGSGTCFVGVTAPPDRPWPGVPVRSEPLTFTGDPEPIRVWVGQALEQQLPDIIHIAPAAGAMRQVVWDRDDGTLTFPHIDTSRWLDPGDDVWDPAPVEDGVYDCADRLEPIADGQEPVHCSMLLVVTEGDVEPGLEGAVSATAWTSTHFARFDLTATVTAARVTSRPTGVRIDGEVTCTGFMPEQYLVHVAGALTQTTTKGRTTTVVTVPFTVGVTCSGTVLNPGTSSWTVTVTGDVKAGPATVTLDVSSPGFTRTGDPLHVVQAVTVQAPPKGKVR